MTVRVKRGLAGEGSMSVLSNLRQDKDYFVMSIDFSKHGIQYRIEREVDGLPSLFLSGHFQITDDVMPSEWIIQGSETGGFQIAPQSWCVEGFWELYFNNEAKAIELYDKAKTRMLG